MAEPYLSERYRRALKRHREVGEPDGYDGPCWGPTAADYAYIDAEDAAVAGSATPTQDRVGRTEPEPQ